MFGFGVIVVAVSVIVGALFVAPLFESKGQFADYNVDANNVAIHGFDTVAYFTDGKPTKGKKDFEHVWNDARWHFASATNRDLFTANPDRYAPQFGGYCAAGVALGEYADVDPEAWTIVDGKLYMISTKENNEVWRKARDAHIDYGTYNWENNRTQFRDNL
jgi:hypothetical protein